jgi:Tfp pilus assembly protein PilZ
MFLSNLRFMPGKAIILKIDVPGSHPVLEVHARVRWIARNREASYKYQTGISFNPYGTGRHDNPKTVLSTLNALEEMAGSSIP